MPPDEGKKLGLGGEVGEINVFPAFPTPGADSMSVKTPPDSTPVDGLFVTVVVPFPML